MPPIIRSHSNVDLQHQHGLKQEHTVAFLRNSSGTSPQSPRKVSIINLAALDIFPTPD